MKAPLAGASVNKAVPTTKGSKVWNRNLQTMWIKNMIFVVYSCICRQKHGPTVKSDYSRHPQNSSSSTGTFRTLVWSLTYAVDWQFLQYRISKEANDRTFRWLCWHTGKKYRAALIEFSQWKVCLRNRRVLQKHGMFRGDRHPTTQFHSWLKDIFWEKWHPKLKNQNLRGGVLCAQSMEERKLQCTAAKYVMWACAWKIALSYITQSFITEVMTSILLHLYSFKISILKF